MLSMIAAMVGPNIDLNVLREKEKQYDEFKKIGRSVEELSRLGTACDYITAKRNLNCYELAITRTNKAIEDMKATFASDIKELDAIRQRSGSIRKDIAKYNQFLYNQLLIMLERGRACEAKAPMMELLKSE